ncbi:MAG: PAS domain-containing protein [Bacteroidota bacterium]
MNEMKFYDEAANRFYSSIDFSSFPLISWDVFSHSFYKTYHGLNDISRLIDLSKENNWKHPSAFKDEILDKNHVIVVTDLHLNIVHATHNIYDMNGYRPEEILGKQPKIFQGKDTCQRTIKSIANAIKNEVPFETIILNYRKDGTPYKCWIKGTPIRDEQNKLVNFIAYEREVA